MVWQDIILNRMLTKAELTEALCLIFQIDSTKIIITPNIETTLFIDEHDVICETKMCKADYPLILSIYLKKEVSWDSVALIGRFCERLSCRAIISDHSRSPFTMLHVTGIECWEQINLDLSSFDDNEGIDLL